MNDMEIINNREYQEWVNNQLHACITCLIEDALRHDTESQFLDCISNFYTEDEDGIWAQEILEWYIVDSLTAERLEEKGEPILRDWNLNIWGRTCSGQAVFLDCVFIDMWLEKEERLKKLMA